MVLTNKVVDGGGGLTVVGSEWPLGAGISLPFAISRSCRMYHDMGGHTTQHIAGCSHSRRSVLLS